MDTTIERRRTTRFAGEAGASRWASPLISLFEELLVEGAEADGLLAAC